MNRFLRSSAKPVDLETDDFAGAELSVIPARHLAVARGVLDEPAEEVEFLGTSAATREGGDEPELLGADDPSFDMAQLGRRLLEVRRRYGWTRADVARLSNGRWSATALGTYERGERMMAAVNLFALADFYRVSVVELMDATPVSPGPAKVSEALVVDTVRLAATDRWPRLACFVKAVQSARQGPPRRMLVLRSRDLPRLAAVHNETVESLVDKLVRDGILGTAD